MTVQKVSGWQMASTVATCAELIIVAISLVLIWSQVRQQKQQLEQQTVQLNQQIQLSKAANTQSLVSLITPLNLRVTDEAITDLWVKGDCGIDKVSDLKRRSIEREQYERLLGSYMTFYENVYSQYRAGLLDQAIYEGWDKDLASFIEGHRIASHWPDWKEFYRKDFSDRVEQIIAAQKPVEPCPK